MDIRLPPEQLEWLRSAVAPGRFESVEEALSSAVLGLMLSDDDDLIWAKPFIDEGRRSFEQDDGLPVEQVVSDLETLISKQRS